MGIFNKRKTVFSPTKNSENETMSFDANQESQQQGDSSTAFKKHSKMGLTGKKSKTGENKRNSFTPVNKGIQNDLSNITVSSDLEVITDDLIYETVVALRQKMNTAKAHFDKDTNPIGKESAEAIIISLIREAISKRNLLCARVITNVNNGATKQFYLEKMNQIEAQEALVSGAVERAESMLIALDSEQSHFEELTKKKYSKSKPEKN